MRIITCLSFLISLIGTQAQDLNVAHHKGSERTYGIQSLNGKYYYLEQSMEIGSCCVEEINLVGVGSSGTTLFRKSLFGYPYPEPALIEKTPAGEFLVCGGTHMKGCDVAVVEYTILKVDTTGTISWKHNLSQPVKSIVPINDSSYFVLCNDQLYGFVNSQPTQTISFGVSNIHHAASLPGNRFVIAYAGAQGFGYLRVTNSNGQPLNTYNITNTVSTLITHHDTIFARCFGQVFRFNDTLGTTGSSANMGIEVFTASGGSVFTAGTNTSGQLFFAVLGPSLSTVHMSQSALYEIFPTGIAYTGAHAGIITSGTSKTQPTQGFTGFFQCAPGGNLVAEKDIGVTRLNVIQANAYYTSPWNATAVGNVQATVKNFGNEAVSRFNLNHYAMIQSTSYCLIGLNKTYTMTILPGDSAVVTTGTFYLNPFVPGSNSVTPYNQNICVFTSVPDNMNDTNIQNDETCMNILVTPTAIREQFPKTGIFVFPNPSANGFRVISQEDLKLILLRDLTGNILEINTNVSDEILIDADLKPGVYILEAETASGRSCHRVIVD